jgi:hypothetical protein
LLALLLALNLGQELGKHLTAERVGLVIMTLSVVMMAVGICVMEMVFALALPTGISVKSLGKAPGAFPAGTLATGYRLALLTGAAICAAACLSSAFVKARPRPGAEPPTGVM